MEYTDLFTDLWACCQSQAAAGGWPRETRLPCHTSLAVSHTVCPRSFELRHVSLTVRILYGGVGLYTHALPVSHTVCLQCVSYREDCVYKHTPSLYDMPDVCSANLTGKGTDTLRCTLHCTHTLHPPLYTRISAQW
jgi:hypothetical protein